MWHGPTSKEISTSTVTSVTGCGRCGTRCATPGSPTTGPAGRGSGPARPSSAAALAVRVGAIGRRPPAPAAESNLTGELHSKERDQAAISHHYDLSNDFYELILDPTMAYSSGFHVTPDMSLEEAQTAKLHLICRKLGLQPGMTHGRHRLAAGAR